MKRKFMRDYHLFIALMTLLILFVVPNSVPAGFLDKLLDSAKQTTESILSKEASEATKPGNEEILKQEEQQNSTQQPAATGTVVQDKKLVAEIQSRLNQLGYNAGPADGLYGAGTRKAIESFQSQHGLQVDGQPTEDLLAQLKKTEKIAVQEATSTNNTGSVAISDNGVREPGNAASLAMVRLHYDPSWLDDEERLYRLTLSQIGQEKHEGGGVHGNPPIFDPASIADREPKFVAHELAPVMRQGLLRIAARVGPEFYRELSWARTEYDFKTQTLSYKKEMLHPASESARAGLPAGVKDRALYDIPRGATFYKETHYGIAAGVEPAAMLLAFDRVLDFEGVSVSPKLAEKITALDQKTVRLLFRVTGAVGDVVLATVEGLEVRPASDKAPLLTLGPESFPSAIAGFALTAGPPPPVTRSFNEVVVSAAEPDMADLVLLHYFPERLDDEYLFILMQERQRIEKQEANPPWGRFFNPTAREVDRADVTRYGKDFQRWTLERAARINDRLVIRVERQRVGYNPNSESVSLTFSSSSSCLEQRNVMSSGAEFGIAVKSTREKCGEQRYLWKRNPEVVIALDKTPLPPPPDVAAKLPPKYLPMEIVIQVTGKKPAQGPGKEDQLVAKLLEVRYYDADNIRVATVKPEAEAQPEKFDPMVRAKTGAPYGPDVVGVRLGMGLKDADGAIRKHDTVSDYLKGKAPFPFDGVYLYVLGDKDEYISLFTFVDQTGERVAALERNVWYLPATTPEDSAVTNALDGKYGPVTERREFPGGFSSHWTADARGHVLDSKAAKRLGCRHLVGSPTAMDVFRTEKGQPYVWALPGLKKVWGMPTNGFGIKRDGKSAADIASCGQELVATWSHNGGEAYGPTLRIKLYDVPWMRAEAEAQRRAAPKIGL
jgi:peptidoglycan hydrolase-like protein with peptidoglycan-binding domain